MKASQRAPHSKVDALFVQLATFGCLRRSEGPAMPLPDRQGAERCRGIPPIEWIPNSARRDRLPLRIEAKAVGTHAESHNDERVMGCVRRFDGPSRRLVASSRSPSSCPAHRAPLRNLRPPPTRHPPRRRQTPRRRPVLLLPGPLRRLPPLPPPARWGGLPPPQLRPPALARSW